MARRISPSTIIIRQNATPLFIIRFVISRTRMSAPGGSNHTFTISFRWDTTCQAVNPLPRQVVANPIPGACLPDTQ
jgi:hypothetical protein